MQSFYGTVNSDSMAGSTRIRHHLSFQRHVTICTSIVTSMQDVDALCNVD